MNEQPDEEIHKARSSTKELRAWGQNGGTWKHFVSLTWKFPEPPPFGFLWKLHYLGIID